MHILLRSIYYIAVCIVIQPQAFPQGSTTIAQRKALLAQQQAPAPAVVLNGRRDPNAILGNSVKAAETTTAQLFTQHYNEAARDATYAKRQQINFLRIKTFQATHTTPAFFNTSITGVKARPEHFQPTLDAANIAMAAAYAPYNNVSRVSKEDVEAFARAYPHEVTGLNLQALEGDLLPPSATGQAFAYNPFSYGMILTYRLRNVDKLQGEAPTVIDLYNKDAAFRWEAAAGIAHEAVGTGVAHTTPTPAQTPATPQAPHVDAQELKAAIDKHQQRMNQAKSGTAAG